MRSILTQAAAAASVIIGSCVATATDWPQWRGPQRTGHVAKGEPVPSSLQNLTVAWNVPIGDGLASPVVSGGKVFYLDNQNNREVVHAAGSSDGKLLWHHELDEAHKDSQSPAGPRCTPVVDGDRIYVQSCRGELRCLNTTDGAVVWRTNYVKDFGAVFTGEKGQAEGARRHGYNGAPLVHGDHLIALVGGKDGAGVVCFDKRKGDVIWKSQDDIPAYAPPVVATVAGREQVLAFTVQGLIALDPTDGKLLWRDPMKTAFGRHVTTPVVVDDVVVVASHQVGLVGVKITNEGDGLKATRAWTEKDLAINFSSPVAVGKHVYGLGPARNIICVDPATGKLAWSKDGFSTSSGDKAHVGMIAMGNNIFVLTDGGEGILVAADPTQYKELGRAQICGKNWCNPAYVNAHLYVRDARELRSVSIANR